MEAWDAGDHTALEAHLVEVATEIAAEAEWEAETSVAELLGASQTLPADNVSRLSLVRE